jgi:hypothetical protein
MNLRGLLRSVFDSSARKRALAVALVPVRPSRRAASRRERAMQER